MSETSAGRKRGRDNHTVNDPQQQYQESLNNLPQALSKLSVEAMFHPKFDNERRTDQWIRQDIQQRIFQNQGYVEVTLKHSGSLVLWSGYDRYYSKNDTANVFTSAAEILLRQHFYRAWNQDRTETQYQECSQFLQDHRWTLAFEVVTSVLGDHGDIPNRDFVLLTAIADKQKERFLSTLELLQVAQRFRLPFNDTWVFASPESVESLFQLYDTSRETGMAQDTVAALTVSGNVHVPSMYPHHVFQGDILEGFIIRYIPYPTDERSSFTQIQDTLHTLRVGAQEILTLVPPALPPSFQVMNDNDKKPQQQLFRIDIRTIYKETHGHLQQGRDKFAQALQEILVHSEDHGHPRRTIRRIPSRNVDIPSLTKALVVESKDPETRRIAEMIQTVADFKGVVYQVVQEVVSSDDRDDDVRWLCIIHVLYDQIFQKFQQRKRPGAMPLFRGFCLELKSADIESCTSSTSTPDDDSGVVDMDIDSPVKCTDRGEETITGELMLKMKFLPYMVRTFICRNNLRIVQQEGPEAFTYSATKLLDRWEVSMAAKQKWIPFFQQWGIYAQSCQQNGNSEPGLPPLTESSYLAHLDHFTKLYENGELPTTNSPESSFQAVAFVVALQRETAEQVANLLAKQLGGAKVRNASHVAHTSPSLGGIVFFAGIADSNKDLRKYLSVAAGHSAVVMYGCSDNDIHQEFEQSRDQKKHIGLRQFWMNMKCGAVINIPKTASLAVEDLPEFQEAVTKIEVLNETAPETSLNKKKRPGPGFLVYFPGIPGCGKSTLTGKNVQKELQRRLADAEGAKEGEPPVVERNVIILQGDEVQGKKFWPTVKIEREADTSCLFIADKNAPATAWGIIGKFCAETSGVPLAVLPDKAALKTTSLRGVWTPNSSVIPNTTTHCYPFSLLYLAVCMARVLERKPSSHAGKLDSGTPNACMIVIKFFSLYRGLSAEDFKGTLQRGMQKAGVLGPPQKAIKLPFFTKGTNLPQDLQIVLTESLQLQVGTGPSWNSQPRLTLYRLQVFSLLV
jgi:hypothetical protein